MKETNSYLAADVDIEGTITCSGPVRVDGTCRGVIEGSENVTIGTSAQIYGTVRAESVVVNGKIEGSLISTGKLAVLSEGNILGKIFTPAGGITIAKGGNFSGEFAVNPAGDPVVQKPTPPVKGN